MTAAQAKPDVRCVVGRPGRGDGPCDNGRYEVVTRSRDRSKVLDRQPACFTHGLAEVDRAHAAGSAAQVEMEPRA